MNLRQKIRNSLFGTDYVAVFYERNVLNIIPVVWINEKPAIYHDGGRRENGMIILPKNGRFEKDVFDEYPYGYCRWEPITEKVKKYYAPTPDPAENTADSSKENKRSSYF